MCSSVLFGLELSSLGSWSGLPWGFLGASSLIVHQHTKITLFLLFGAIAFPDCLQISVLRGFLGGLFGFMGARCIFDWVAAFVGLVGLYACNVRRLRTEKRNAAYFLGLLRSCCCLLWFVLCLLPGLLCSCCLWVSLGLWAFLFPFG